MLQKVKQYYDYEIDFNSLKVDECEFHPDTLLPKSLIYKKFDLLPKIDKVNVWTFSSKYTLLEENSEGKYTGILNREKLLYQNIKTIETHKFHINNEIRNTFSNPDNIDTFERVTKNYYNTIKEKKIARKQEWRELNKERLNEQLTCGCGGKFKYRNKAEHNRGKKHIAWAALGNE
jgi:hypothetical protein